MYTRYSDAKIKNDSDGKRYLSQVIYPSIVESENDLYIISVKGDRLDLYAKRFLGDEKLYYIIAQANGLGKGSLAVPPGLQIRIPSIDSLSKIYADFKDINNF
jgi:hypothetical protein